MALSDYSSTPANNTSINGIDISEGCSPANINNAQRQLMADIADADLLNKVNNAVSTANNAVNTANTAATTANNMVNQAAVSASDASTYATNAANSAAAAANSATAASNYATAASQAQTAAEFARDKAVEMEVESDGNAAAAHTYMTRAKTWDEGTDADVADLGGTHSAKEWATIAGNVASSAAASAAEAETWAEGNDTDVAALGGTHSSKNWAAEAGTSAGTASGYADEAEAWAKGSDADVGAYVPGEHSAKTYAADAQAYAQAADTAELNAEHWAEGSDADVSPLGGTHSAKGWAELAEQAPSVSLQRVEEARRWAEGTDAEVTSLGGTHSAKGWAELSEQSATDADDAKTDAIQAKNDAVTAKTAAEAAQTAAETAQTDAGTAASTAAVKAGEAATSASNAATAKTAAETAQVAAETAASTASTEASNASTYASNANTYKTNAQTYMNNAEKWAEGTDAEVAALGGTHSAKEYARLAGEKSQVWAEGTDAQIALLGGEHSAKEWADIAEHAAATATGVENIASTTPAANKIVQADNNGKIDAGWLPDTYIPVSDKATTATANKVVTALSTGKIDDNWLSSNIPLLSNGKLDSSVIPDSVIPDVSDAVRTSDVSTLSTANKIVEADSSGKIDDAWLSSNIARLNDIPDVSDVIRTTDVATTSTANKVVKADSNGKINANWLPSGFSGSGEADNIGDIKIVALNDNSLDLTKYIATGNWYLKSIYSDLATLYPYSSQDQGLLSYAVNSVTNPLYNNSIPLSYNVTDENLVSTSIDGKYIAIVDETRTKVLLYRIDFSEGGGRSPEFTLLTTLTSNYSYIHAVKIDNESLYENTTDCFVSILGGTSTQATGFEIYSFNSTVAFSISLLKRASLSYSITIDSTDLSWTNKLFYIGYQYNPSTSYRGLFITGKSVVGLTEYTYKISNQTFLRNISALKLVAQDKEYSLIIDSNNQLIFRRKNNPFSSITTENTFNLTTNFSINSSDVLNAEIFSVGRANPPHLILFTTQYLYIFDVQNTSLGNMHYYTKKELSGVPSFSFGKIQPNLNRFILFSSNVGYIFSTSSFQYLNYFSGATGYNVNFTNNGIVYRGTKIGFPATANASTFNSFYVPLFEVPSGYKAYVRALN